MTSIRKPTERRVNSEYIGTYVRMADKKSRIFIPSEIERTIVSRNSSLDDKMDSPIDVFMHLTKSGINCYDACHYLSIKSGINNADVYPSSLDAHGRMGIPKDLASRYPIRNPVTLKASKDGKYFMIQSGGKK